MRAPTAAEADQLIASLRQRGLLGAPAQVLDQGQAEKARKAEDQLAVHRSRFSWTPDRQG